MIQFFVICGMAIAFAVVLFLCAMCGYGCVWIYVAIREEIDDYRTPTRVKAIEDKIYSVDHKVDMLERRIGYIDRWLSDHKEFPDEEVGEQEDKG
jgi:hypothetical protein